MDDAVHAMPAFALAPQEYKSGSWTSHCARVVTALHASQRHDSIDVSQRHASLYVAIAESVYRPSLRTVLCGARMSGVSLAGRDCWGTVFQRVGYQEAMHVPPCYTALAIAWLLAP